MMVGIPDITLRHRWLWIVLLMILGIGGRTMLVDSYAADEEEPWRINFVPVLWVPESTVRLEVNGTPSDVDESPNREDLTFNPNLMGIAFGAVRNGWG